MLLVADTHSLVWFLTDDKRLGPEARRLFEEADMGGHTVVIPSIVLAEFLHIALKKDLEVDFSELLGKVESSANYVCYDLGIGVLRKCVELVKLRDIHDKIIVATAVLANARLITKDKSISASGYVGTVW